MTGDSPDFSTALSAILDGIEEELRRNDLWVDKAPGAAALGSPLPFCYDTLMFHQWLQWVFLPRARQIADGDIDAPESSAILPYAEESLLNAPGNFDQLTFLIRTFDELIEMVAGR